MLIVHTVKLPIFSSHMLSIQVLTYDEKYWDRVYVSEGFFPCVYGKFPGTRNY